MPYMCTWIVSSSFLNASTHIFTLTFKTENTKTLTYNFSSVTICMKKLPDSDWLRAVQFKRLQHQYKLHIILWIMIC